MGSISSNQVPNLQGLTERRLNHADLRCRCLQAGKRTPIVYDKAGANDVRTSVYRASLSRFEINLSTRYKKEIKVRTTRGI